MYEKIKKEHLRLQKQIKTVQDTIDTMPEGKLICCHQGTHCKWYLSDGHTKTYIPKSNRSLAEQLAAKKYLSTLNKDMKKELKALEFYLRHYDRSPSKAYQLLTEPSGYLELLSPYFQPLSQELDKWASASFPKNPAHPEHLIHKTVSGHLVRSKSEAMIDLFLSSNHIPFRYECKLSLDEQILYPDFTIRHPHTGEYIYWEHFGLMDDPVYCQNVGSKISLYSSHGIIPSIHLITTYETQNHPLSTETIQNIINHYFQ